MKKSLLALASGAFILGAAEFVMMGILPQTAEAMHVDIPTAGHFISAYAIGVCIGTLILAVALLIFGPTKLPKLGKAIGQTIGNFKRSSAAAEKAEEKHDSKES